LRVGSEVVKVVGGAVAGATLCPVVVGAGEGLDFGMVNDAGAREVAPQPDESSTANAVASTPTRRNPCACKSLL